MRLLDLSADVLQFHFHLRSQVDHLYTKEIDLTCYIAFLLKLCWNYVQLMKLISYLSSIASRSADF
jgi:hypothetical protein